VHLAWVDGVGAIFSIMLEDLGVCDVLALAGQEPGALRARLRVRHR
jgi:hypothetical protein